MSSSSTSSSATTGSPCQPHGEPSSGSRASSARTRVRSDSNWLSCSARRSASVRLRSPSSANRAARGLGLAAPRQQSTDREARELVLAAGERERRRPRRARGPPPRGAPAFRAGASPRRQRLELGALAREIDLRLAHVLLEEQRPILERFDHAVGVGLHERGDAIEQLERHGRPPCFSASRRRGARRARPRSAPC